MASERFTNALNRKEQNIPPVWMMRQAGRYHAHYQKLRQAYSFMELCKIPEVAAEVALGPVADFDFDLAILFSDILFPLEALGMGLEYTEKGPKLGWQLNNTNMHNLASPDVAIEELVFQRNAMQFTRKAIPTDKSVIGFIGGIWTLFTYAVSGKHDGHLIDAKKLAPAREHFFEVMENLLTMNIELQLEGGAEVVMIFDTAAGELSPQFFDMIVVPYVQRFAKKFPKKIGYYSKGTSEFQIEKIFQIKELAGTGFDHRLSMSKLIGRNESGFTQGNFDQALLFLERDDFRKALRQYIQSMKELSPSDRKGWVSGLGHGVMPNTPEDHVREFVQTIREEFA